MSPRYGADDAENSELIVVNLWEIMRASNTAALGFVDISKPRFRSRAPSASRRSISWMGPSPSPPRSGQGGPQGILMGTGFGDRSGGFQGRAGPFEEGVKQPGKPA